MSAEFGWRMSNGRTEVVVAAHAMAATGDGVHRDHQSVLVGIGRIRDQRPHADKQDGSSRRRQKRRPPYNWISVAVVALSP
jgi:hypothetical protein